MFGAAPLDRPYKGYIIEGSAEPLAPYSDLWAAVATVLLKKPGGSVLQVERHRVPMLTYEDGDLAAWFGLGIAEISVDRCLPAPSYYLTPMTAARAVDILRCGAEDHHNKEIRTPELYNALAFLDQFLGRKNWLVRRYRNSLRGDARNQREKMEQRERLRVRFRGIQQACIETILDQMNELALQYRENRSAIEMLRRQLAAVRRPISN